MSKKNEKTQFNCRIDKELLDDYKKVVPNASEDIREYMQRRVNQKTNLQELQKIRLDKIKERDMLNIEIEELEEEIAEAKRLRHENNLNNQALHNAMETVIKLSASGIVKGVTRNQVRDIAERNDINEHDLFRECKKHDVKFITEKMAEVNFTTNVKDKHAKMDEESDDQSIIRAIDRDYSHKKKQYNNNIAKYLDDPENQAKYKRMAKAKGINYDELIEKIKNGYKKQ